MSDNNLEKLEKQTSQSQDPSAPTEKKESSRKSLFENLNLNQDLKQALNSWDSLAEKPSTKRTHNEEQLQEMKKLLSELKSKLSEFE